MRLSVPLEREAILDRDRAAVKKCCEITIYIIARRAICCRRIKAALEIDTNIMTPSCVAADQENKFTHRAPNTELPPENRTLT